MALLPHSFHTALWSTAKGGSGGFLRAFWAIFFDEMDFTLGATPYPLPPPAMQRVTTSSGDELDRMTNSMPLAHVVSDVILDKDEHYLCAALHTHITQRVLPMCDPALPFLPDVAARGGWLPV